MNCFARLFSADGRRVCKRWILRVNLGAAEPNRRGEAVQASKKNGFRKMEDFSAETEDLAPLFVDCLFFDVSSSEISHPLQVGCRLPRKLSQQAEETGLEG